MLKSPKTWLAVGLLALLTSCLGPNHATGHLFKWNAEINNRWGRSVVSTQIVRIGHAYEDLLTESLSRDFRMPVDQIGTPRLVAIMLWGVNGHVQRLYATREEFDLLHEAVAVVDRVEELFGHLVQN